MELGRSSGRGGRDRGHEERVPLVGDGHLGAERHLVDRAGDAMPVVAGDTEDADVADGNQQSGQH